MHLVADLQISIDQSGDPPRLCAIVQPTKDGEPIGEPSEPVYLTPGLVLTYGPVGLECSVDSKLSTEEGQGGGKEDEPTSPSPQRPAAPQRPAVKAGQAQLNKLR